MNPAAAIEQMGTFNFAGAYLNDPHFFNAVAQGAARFFESNEVPKGYPVGSVDNRRHPLEGYKITHVISYRDIPKAIRATNNQYVLNLLLMFQHARGFERAALTQMIAKHPDMHLPKGDSRFQQRLDQTRMELIHYVKRNETRHRAVRHGKHGDLGSVLSLLIQGEQDGAQIQRHAAFASPGEDIPPTSRMDSALRPNVWIMYAATGLRELNGPIPTMPHNVEMPNDTERFSWTCKYFPSLEELKEVFADALALREQISRTRIGDTPGSTLE